MKPIRKDSDEEKPKRKLRVHQRTVAGGKARIKEYPEEIMFIERKIVTGLIVSTEYIKQIRPYLDPNLFGVREARMIINWCIEFFDKYDSAPQKEIESILKEKSKKLNKDIVADIEQILTSLDGDYVKQDNFNIWPLIDQTRDHLKAQKTKQYVEEIQKAANNSDWVKLAEIQASFNLFSNQSDEDKGYNPVEIRNKDIPPTKWLIDNFLPRGLTVFAGRPKLGKSYLMLYISFFLAQGKEMFNEEADYSFKGDRGSILYLALEDPDRRIKNRLNQLEKIDQDVVDRLLIRYMRIYHNWENLKRGGLAKLEAWIKSAKRPKLIIIDTIVRVWDMKTGTGAGRQYNEEYQIYGPLADLAHEYDISIIAITHTKKSKESDVFNEILGGAGTQGPADNLMVLSPHPENSKYRILSIRSKEAGEKHLTFEVNEGAAWNYLGEQDEVQKSSQRQSIVEYLKINGEKTYKEIREAAINDEIQISPNSVNTVLRKMVSDGDIFQINSRGTYSIQNSGQHIKIGKNKGIL